MPPGDMAMRLSASGSGWFLDADGHSRQVLCGDVDALVGSLLKNSHRRLLAISVSSVLPGLCLGPALNLAVHAMASSRNQGADGYVPLRTDERIAIVSRSHSLRDYLAESTLRFGLKSFPFMQFPTFRLRRNGEVEAARFGRKEDRRRVTPFTESPEFLFYDLSPLHLTDGLPDCAIVLAELSESDRPDYIDRLMEFARASHARHVFPIVSYHDAEKRRLLEGLGFTIITVTKGTGSDAPDFTFASLTAATPTKTRFGVICCDQPTATAVVIDSAYRMLRDLWRLCGSLPQPRQLRTVWSLLDEMSAAPSSLQTLEAIRRDAPGVTTIRFGLEKSAHLDCTGLPNHLQDAFTLRWPHLRELLFEIYDQLYVRNPVGDTLIERILDASSSLTVMTRSDTAAAALQRDLLFNWEWKNKDGAVRIGAAATLCRQRTISRNLLAVGFNPNSRPQLYWSGLPANFEVITYPHALAALAEYQTLLRRSVADLLPKNNGAALTTLLSSHDVRITKATVFELECTDLSTSISAFAAVRRTASATLKDDPSALLTEDEIGLMDIVVGDVDRAPESEPTAAAEEQVEGPFVVIHFAGGSEHRAALTTSFAVLPADTEELVKLTAGELSQGDRIILLSEDEHRSVYGLIAERTRHLFPMDDRTLELWDAAKDLLRAQYPPDQPSAIEAFCQRLEGERCRRGRQSMRQWLSGRVLAPEAAEDVEILLRVAGNPGDTAAIAKIVSAEIERYRNFRRTIGRAIVRRTVTRAERRAVRGRLEEEIDEVLELCDVREVEGVDVFEPIAP